MSAPAQGDQEGFNVTLDVVEAYYGRAARSAKGGEQLEEQCAPGACGPGNYSAEDLADLPEAAVAASAGCANPVALIDLRGGETVLDLGSGGGIDVLLSARRVGPSGRVFGLDTTEEMLAVAREDARRAGAENVEFLMRRIEDIPLPDHSTDVVLSNCVVNLSADKGAVFRETYRVLRPEGRLAFADLIAERELRERSDHDDLWAAALAGPLTREGYERGLLEAGFREVSMQKSHEVAPGLSSVVVRAIKPAASARTR